MWCTLYTFSIMWIIHTLFRVLTIFHEHELSLELSSRMNDTFWTCLFKGIHDQKQVQSLTIFLVIHAESVQVQIAMVEIHSNDFMKYAKTFRIGFPIYCFISPQFSFYTDVK